MLVNTPKPPYFAVVFTSKLRGENKEYDLFNASTEGEVKKIDGFIGSEALRDNNGFGIHVSYWKDMDSIKQWRNNQLHDTAIKKGIENWYAYYAVRITKVERDSIMNL